MVIAHAVFVSGCSVVGIADLPPHALKVEAYDKGHHSGVCKCHRWVLLCHGLVTPKSKLFPFDDSLRCGWKDLTDVSVCISMHLQAGMILPFLFSCLLTFFLGYGLPAGGITGPLLLSFSLSVLGKRMVMSASRQRSDLPTTTPSVSGELTTAEVQRSDSF